MPLRDLKEQLAEAQDGVADDISEDDIEIVDDRPPQDQREPADLDSIDDGEYELSDDEMQTLSERAKKRIKHLTWRAKEEERQRKEALRVKQEAIEHAQRLQYATQAQIRQYQQAVLERQKALSSTQVRDAQAELAVAHEEGDPAKIAEAQAKLTRAINAETQTTQYEQSWQRQTGQHEQQGENGDGTPQQGQPIQRPAMSERMQEWVQKNPWFQNNRRMYAYGMAVHQDLLEDGVEPESDEYFAAVDREMRKAFPDYFNSGNSGSNARGSSITGQAGTVTVDTESGQQSSPAQTRSRARTPVAPTRGRKSGSSSSGKIQLTRTEVQTAKALGVPLVEYARQKRELERNNG